MSTWRTILSWKVGIQEGDKVVPISKSIGCDWSISGAVRFIQASPQKYLYLNWVEEQEGKLLYHCWWERRTEYNTSSGDFFLESDLVPYYE